MPSLSYIWFDLEISYSGYLILNTYCWFFFGYVVCFYLRVPRESSTFHLRYCSFLWVSRRKFSLYQEVSLLITCLGTCTHFLKMIFTVFSITTVTLLLGQIPDWKLQKRIQLNSWWDTILNRIPVIRNRDYWKIILISIQLQKKKMEFNLKNNHVQMGFWIGETLNCWIGLIHVQTQNCILKNGYIWTKF